ncbi:MAG: transglutaminase domain-containing protein [Bacteroidota bacterium]
MNKAILLIFFTVLFPARTFPQPAPDYRHADAVALSTPDSVGRSIVALSSYFGANLHTVRDLTRAFYTWTATSIDYDVKNMFSFRPKDDPQSIVSRALLDRKAVCQGYSGVFHELCDKAGIENYMVLGYSRQNGEVVTINHAWVVARIDSSWYLFDPTWGSGFLLNGNFTRKFTDEYFMVSPAVFIQSHMPFDPLWQCLHYPVTSRDFLRGTLPKNDTARYFSYPDSIVVYNRLSQKDKFSATFRRVEKNGVTNSSVAEYLRFLQQSIDIEEANHQNEVQNQLVNQFNEAVNHYNTASLLFNDYIGYWNHQFKPARPDAGIQKMVDSCNYHLAQSRNILAAIEPEQETLRQNKELLLKAIGENQKHVNEQNAFLKEYFMTPKASRGALFTRFPGPVGKNR